MQGHGKVDTLAIQHFQELKEAWQFEHDAHLRLDHIAQELLEEVSELKSRVSDLERDVDLEATRADLALRSSDSPSNPNSVVRVVRSWIPEDLRCSVCCCLRMGPQWIMTDDGSSSIATDRTDILDQLASVDSGREDASQDDLWSLVSELSSASLHALQWGPYSRAFSFSILSKCVWIIRGADSEEAMESMRDLLPVLSTATRLCMGSLALHMKEAERSLQLAALSAGAQLTNNLNVAALRPGHLPSRVWWNIPDIIEKSINSIEDMLGGSSRYTVDVFRTYADSSSSYSAPMLLLSAKHKRVVTLSSTSLAMSAMNKQLPLSKSFPGFKNGANAALYATDESDLNFSIRGDISSALVIVPVVVSEAADVDSDDSIGELCMGFISFTKNYAAGNASSSDQGVSDPELARIETLCASALPPMLSWMHSHTIDTLLSEESLVASAPPTMSSREQILGMEVFESVWRSYVEKTFTAKAPVRNSMDFFIAHLRGDFFSGRDKKSKMPDNPASMDAGSLTKMVARSIACSWASAVLVNDYDDLLVMDDIGHVTRTNESGLRSSLSSAAGLEEKRLAQIFNLLVLGNSNSVKSEKMSTDVHMFENVDILQSGILSLTVSDGFRDVLKRRPGGPNRKPSSTWCVVMVVLPLRDVVPIRGLTRNRYLVLFGGREWHPKRMWNLDTGVQSLSTSFSSRLKGLLNLMHNARVCAEQVNNDIPTISSELADLRQEFDTTEVEYSAVKALSSHLNTLLRANPSEFISPNFNLSRRLWHALAGTFQDLLSPRQCSQTDERSNTGFDILLCDGITENLWLLHPEDKQAWKPFPGVENAACMWVDVELYNLPVTSEWANVDNDLSDFSIILRIQGGNMFNSPRGARIRCMDVLSDHCNSRAVVSWIDVLRSFFCTMERQHSRTVFFQNLVHCADRADSVKGCPAEQSKFSFVSKMSTKLNGPNQEFVNSFKFAYSVAADSLSMCPSSLINNCNICDGQNHDPENVLQLESAAGAAYFGSRSYWDKILSNHLSSSHDVPVSSFVIPLVVFKVLDSDSSMSPTYLGRDLLNDSNNINVNSSYMPRGMLESILVELSALKENCFVRLLSPSCSAAIEKYLYIRQHENDPDFSSEKKMRFLSEFKATGVTVLVKGSRESDSVAEVCDKNVRDSLSPSDVCCNSFFNTEYHTLLHLPWHTPFLPTALNHLAGTLQASLLPLCTIKASGTLQQCTKDLQNLLLSGVQRHWPPLEESRAAGSPLKLGEISSEKIFKKFLTSEWESAVRLLEKSSNMCIRIVHDFEETLRYQSGFSTISRVTTPCANATVYVAASENTFTRYNNSNSADSSAIPFPAMVPKSHDVISTAPSFVFFDSDDTDAGYSESVNVSHDGSKSWSSDNPYCRVVSEVISIAPSGSPLKRNSRTIKSVSFSPEKNNATQTVGSSPNATIAAIRDSQHYIRVRYYSSANETESVVSSCKASPADNGRDGSLIPTLASTVNPFKSFSSTDTFSPEKKTDAKGQEFSPGVDSTNTTDQEIMLFAVILIPLSPILAEIVLHSRTTVGVNSHSEVVRQMAHRMSHVARHMFDRFSWFCQCTILQLQGWVHRTYRAIMIQQGNRSVIKGHVYRGASFSDWTNENIRDLFEKAKMMSTHDIGMTEELNADEEDACKVEVGRGPTFLETDDDELNVVELTKMKRTVETTLRSLLAKYQAANQELRETRNELLTMTEKSAHFKRCCKVRDTIVGHFFETLLGLRLNEEDKGADSRQAFDSISDLIKNRAYSWPHSIEDMEHAKLQENSVFMITGQFTDRSRFYKDVIIELTDLLCEVGLRDEASRRIMKSFGSCRSVVLNCDDSPIREAYQTRVDIFWANSDLTVSVPCVNKLTVTEEDEQKDLMVSSRPVPPLSIVRYPSMFQWAVASGQALTVREDANGTVTKSSVRNGDSDSSRIPGGATTYIPIVSCSLHRDGSKQNTLRETYTKSSGVVCMIEYCAHNQESENDDRLAQIRLQLLNSEFENTVRVLARKSRDCEVFTSSGYQPSDATTELWTVPKKLTSPADVRMSVADREAKFRASVQMVQMMNSLATVCPSDDHGRFEALSIHIGTMAAGLLRGHCGVFALPPDRFPKSEGSSDVVGNVWKYETESSSVEYLSRKLTVDQRTLCDAFVETNVSSKEELLYSCFHTLQGNQGAGQLDSDTEILFTPVPSFGASVLEVTGGGTCCRLLCPIFLPSRAENELGTLRGYLLCESDRKFDANDVMTALAITKLAALIAITHSQRELVSGLRVTQEKNDTSANELRSFCEYQNNMLRHHAALSKFVSRVEESRQSLARDITTDYVVREVCAFVESDLPNVLGCNSANWQHMNSDDAFGLLGSVSLQKVADEVEPLTHTASHGILPRHDNAEVEWKSYMPHFLSNCVCYRLPANKSHSISVSQASSLVYHLLQRHNELKRNNGIEKTGSVIVALNCCQGLFDSPDGPVCVVAVNSNPLALKITHTTTPGDIITRGDNVSTASSEGIWVLVLKFSELEQWKLFMGYDGILSDDKSVRFGVGGISCLLSCCNILSAVASSCYQHRDRNASEHRMIATSLMQDNVHNSIVAIKKAREEGVILNVKKYAAAVANSLSIPLSRDSIKTIFSGDDNSAEGSSLGIPDTFDLSLPLRNVLADNNVLVGCAHRIISARLFWKGTHEEDASKWMTVNSVKNNDGYSSGGAATNDSSDSATANLIYSLREHHTHAISLRSDTHGGISEDEARLQNILDKCVSSSSNDCLYAKRIFVSGHGLKRHTLLESNEGYAVIALYFSVCRLSLVTNGTVRSTGENSPTFPIGLGKDSSSEYLQPNSAVLEVYVHVSISPHLMCCAGWRKIILDPVPQSGVIAIYANQMNDEIFKTVVILKEAVSSEYRSIEHATQSRCLIDKQKQSINSAVNAMGVISSCLQELHAEGGKLASTMRRVESLICALDPEFDSVKVYVSVARRSADATFSHAARETRSPASSAKEFTQRTDSFSPPKYVSPMRSPVNRQEFVSEASILYETPGALGSMRFSAIGGESINCNIRCFDFACYEVVGRLTFEFFGDPQDFMRKHEILLLAFAKALGRRCYEFYRGSRNKKQLIQEVQKVTSLEAELKNMRSALNRKDDELVQLEETRNNLQNSLRRLDVDAAKVRDMLRSEQQALHAAQKEKRDLTKHMKRVADETKGEFSRKERELRKKISDLSRGVYAGDKDYEQLKSELDRVTAKAAKLEGKKAQLIKDFDDYKIQCEEKNRLNDSIVHKLQDERQELLGKLAVYEERLNTQNSSSDDRHHASLLRLRTVEEQLVSAKAAASSYKKQSEEATRCLDRLKIESERLKEQSETSMAESRRRLRAAETLIEQLHQHKNMSPAYCGHNPGSPAVGMSRLTPPFSPGNVSSPRGGVQVGLLSPDTAEKARNNTYEPIEPVEPLKVLELGSGITAPCEDRSPVRSLSVARTLSPG